jgi:hypothetical protein
MELSIDIELVAVIPGRRHSRAGGATRKGLFIASVLMFPLFMVSCGTDNAQLTLTPRVLLSIDPTSAVMLTGETQQFNATVLGTTNHSATWSVNDIAGGDATVGTISSTGLYTAPAAVPSGALTIRAVSQADSSAADTAALLVASPGVVTATNNPQVAMYSFSSPEAATVTIEFGPDSSYSLRTWSRPIPAGGGQVDILVAGMRAFTTYHMRAVVDFPGGLQLLDDDHTFTTGGLPAARLPQLTVTRPTGLTPNPGVELLNLINLPGANTTALQPVVVD